MNPTDAQYNPPIPEPTSGPVDTILSLPITGADVIILIAVALTLIAFGLLLREIGAAITEDDDS